MEKKKGNACMRMCVLLRLGIKKQTEKTLTQLILKTFTVLEYNRALWGQARKRSNISSCDETIIVYVLRLWLSKFLY